MEDFQREAWEKAQRRFPWQPLVGTPTWIDEGVILLDLDGTEIGRHLGPELSSFPLWGHRRPLGLSPDGLVIPYAAEKMDQAAGGPPALFIPWARLQPGFDACHFNVVADGVTTLRLSEEAASAVRARLEAFHG